MQSKETYAFKFNLTWICGGLQSQSECLWPEEYTIIWIIVDICELILILFIWVVSFILFVSAAGSIHKGALEYSRTTISQVMRWSCEKVNREATFY